MKQTKDWKLVTREHVIRAIKRFVEERPEYPAARSTYLIYGGKKYPAKHIRGMAYREAFGIEIGKDEYSGGMETVRFFERLGFETLHIEKPRLQETPDEAKEEGKRSDKKVKLRVCMYLQTEDEQEEEPFEKAMRIVKANKVDILVFPEFCYVPFLADVCFPNILSERDYHSFVEKAERLSRELGCALIVNSEDIKGHIYSIYVNAGAKKNETKHALYIKHTMTGCSAFEAENYPEVIESLFRPIAFKGYKIGMSICYDCNHSLFGRIYGLQGVDLILNSTGGDVVYSKWYRYNKARAIENHCFNLVTMGGYSEHNYVYGFNRLGGVMEPVCLNRQADDAEIPAGLFLFDLEKDDAHMTAEEVQLATENKYQAFKAPATSVHRLLQSAKKLSQGLYVRAHEDCNLVIAILEGDDILKAEKVLPLLYSEVLKPIPNKRYILVSHYEHLDEDKFRNQLSTVLKVRAMENFCAVILYSDTINVCYQTGKAKNPQELKAVRGMYGIDLGRISGPEAIWRNKEGCKAAWRENFERLIAYSNQSLSKS